MSVLLTRVVWESLGVSEGTAAPVRDNIIRETASRDLPWRLEYYSGPWWITFLSDGWITIRNTERIPVLSMHRWIDEASVCLCAYCAAWWDMSWTRTRGRICAWDGRTVNTRIRVNVMASHHHWITLERCFPCIDEVIKRSLSTIILYLSS
jgi:hypothetical protein